MKKSVTRSADAWLVYSELGKQRLVSWGIPPERVMVAYNTLDVESIRRHRRSHEAVTELRRRLGLEFRPILLYCGGIYPTKRLDFRGSSGWATSRGVR